MKRYHGSCNYPGVFDPSEVKRKHEEQRYSTALFKEQLSDMAHYNRVKCGLVMKDMNTRLASVLSYRPCSNFSPLNNTSCEKGSGCQLLRSQTERAKCLYKDTLNCSHKLIRTQLNTMKVTIATPTDALLCLCQERRAQLIAVLQTKKNDAIDSKPWLPITRSFPAASGTIDGLNDDVKDLNIIKVDTKQSEAIPHIQCERPDLANMNEIAKSAPYENLTESFMGWMKSFSSHVDTLTRLSQLTHVLLGEGEWSSADIMHIDNVIEKVAAQSTDIKREFQDTIYETVSTTSARLQSFIQEVSETVHYLHSQHEADLSNHKKQLEVNAQLNDILEPRRVTEVISKMRDFDILWINKGRHLAKNGIWNKYGSFRPCSWGRVIPLSLFNYKTNPRFILALPLQLVSNTLTMSGQAFLLGLQHLSPYVRTAIFGDEEIPNYLNYLSDRMQQTKQVVAKEAELFRSGLHQTRLLAWGGSFYHSNVDAIIDGYLKGTDRDLLKPYQKANQWVIQQKNVLDYI